MGQLWPSSSIQHYQTSNRIIPLAREKNFSPCTPHSQTRVPPAAAQLTLAPAGVLFSVTVNTKSFVLVTLTVVTGFQFVSVMVFRGAVTVLIVTETPLEIVIVGVVVVVEGMVLVPVMVVGGAVEMTVEL